MGSGGGHPLALPLAASSLLSLSCALLSCGFFWLIAQLARGPVISPVSHPCWTSICSSIEWGGAGKEVPVLLGAAQEMYTVHFILTIELGLAIIALKSMPAYDLLICLLP